MVGAGESDWPRALLDAAGCYTTARVESGEARWAERHCRRLRRDATALGLDAPPDDRILLAFHELARAEFGSGDGIIRLAACRDADDRSVLVGTPRPIGHEPPAWHAVRGPEPHPGPRPPLGAKLTERAFFDRAKDFADSCEADEAVLLDTSGRLVEGARSNLLIVTVDGRLVRPHPGLGAVAGVALELVLEQLPAVYDAEIDDTALADAREVIAVNAVRAAAPVVELDGRPVSDGIPGPHALELRERLA